MQRSNPAVALTIACAFVLSACSGESSSISEPVSGKEDTSIPEPGSSDTDASSVDSGPGPSDSDSSDSQISTSPDEGDSSGGIVMLDSENKASRFLSMAGFGGSMEDINDWTNRTAADWLEEQFNLPKTQSFAARMQQRYPDVDSINGRPVSRMFWQAMINDEDQLRKRMAYALSQIIVASEANGGSRGALRMSHYADILDTHAFGNFRDLLYDITYSPAMAKYLTYFRNRKANENTGRQPDENYAREIMQLFTIGLIELNLDGTPKLDSNGNQIETYTNEDVVGLARVFTGLSYDRENFFGADVFEDSITPLKMFEDKHSEKEKTFLGTTIPAGTSGTESINIAIDTLFNHPNVAPFISRQLIQRFTVSNPAPEYVARVAAAFESGAYIIEGGQSFGNGTRGDLKATLAAVLLDPAAHRAESDTASGKVREPVLRFVQMLRAFNAQPVDIINIESGLNNTSSAVTALGQHPLRAPSVFNFYRPGYVPPNTMSGEAGSTVPELQIVNEGSALGFLNFITKYSAQRSRNPGDDPSLVPDFDELVNLTDDPSALVRHLDTLLVAGQLGDYNSARIEAIVSSLPIHSPREEEDRLSRVYAAVIAVMSSSANATY